jgi:hypothetical protein
MIVCLNFFEKIALGSSMVIILTLFSVSLSCFKTSWVCQLRIYETSFQSRGKDTMIKDFKSKILTCLNLHIVKL